MKGHFYIGWHQMCLDYRLMMPHTPLGVHLSKEKCDTLWLVGCNITDSDTVCWLCAERGAFLQSSFFPSAGLFYIEVCGFFFFVKTLSLFWSLDLKTAAFHFLWYDQSYMHINTHMKWVVDDLQGMKMWSVFCKGLKICLVLMILILIWMCKKPQFARSSQKL